MLSARHVLCCVAIAMAMATMGAQAGCRDNSQLQPGELIQPNGLCFVRASLASGQCLSVFGYKCNVDQHNKTAGVPTNAQWNTIVGQSATVLMPSDWLDQNSLNYTLHVMWTCGPKGSANPDSVLSRTSLQTILTDGLATRLWLRCLAPTDSTGRTSQGLCINQLDNQIILGPALSDDALIALLAASTC